MLSAAFERQIPLPLLSGAREIVIFFHPTRCRVLRWQPEPKGSKLEWDVSRSRTNRLVLLVHDPAKAPRTVAVRSLLGPPETVRYELSRSKHLAVSHVPSGPAAVTAALEIDGLDPEAPDAAGHLDEIWNVLDDQEDSRRSRYRRFFADLDRWTNPALRRTFLKDDPVTLERIEIHEPVVRAILWDRIAQRSEALAGAPACPPYPGSEDVLEDVRFLSELLLGLLHEHFSLGDGLLDIPAIEDAFEMFANGELRLQLPSLAWAVQASSGYYFLFGEFALLAATCGLEQDLWTRLANAMVRSQRIFARVYAPSGGVTRKTTLEDYEPKNRRPDRAFTSLEKAELRTDFAGRTLEELTFAAHQHLARFAPGTLPGTRPARGVLQSKGTRMQSQGRKRKSAPGKQRGVRATAARPRRR